MPVALPDYAPQSERLLPLPLYIDVTDFSCIFSKKDIVIPLGFATLTCKSSQ